MRVPAIAVVVGVLMLGCTQVRAKPEQPPRRVLTAAAAGAVTDAVRTAQAQPAAAPEAARGHGAERYRLVSRPDEIVAFLQNGMTVITKRVPSPVLAVRGYVRTGGIYEGRWLGGGLSHLLEHLVAFGSTERRSEAESRALLQQIGNNANAYTTVDHTAYFINTTPEHLRTAVDLLTDWLLHAKIPEAEYRREYEVVQRELEKGKGEPGRQFAYLSALTRYRVHPLRVPVIGYQEVIRGLTRDDVYEYYTLAYQPNNIVLALAGDRDPEEMLRVVQRHVGGAAPGREFSHELPAEPPVLTPRTVVATFPKLGQASLELGFPTIRLDHPDLYALDLLSAVLSHGESSLLVEEMRDKRRLVNGISSSSHTPEYVDGTFAIDMRLAPEQVPAATAAVIELIERLKRDGVSEERVKRAKTQMKVGRIRRLQTAAGTAASLAADYLSAGDPHFSDRYVERIQAVRPEELQAVAVKYLDTSRLLTTAMLPAEFVGAEGLPKAEELIRPVTPTPTERTAEAAAGVSRVVLENGTILLHKRVATTPLVAVTMYALGGLTAEDERTNGLGNLTMAMLPRGTRTRSAPEIAAFFDAIGGGLSTSMGSNTWHWSMSSLREDFPKAFEVFADVVTEPAFPEADLAAAKQRTLAAIESRDASWSSQAFHFFRQAYYGPMSSPYRFFSIGTTENVAAFTRADLARWYRDEVLSSRRVLAIFGDVERAQAERLARTHLGVLPPARDGAPSPPASRAGAPGGGTPAIEVERVEVQTTQQPVAGIVIGFKSDAVVGDPGNYALVVADTLTSGFNYPTGYLHEILRGRGLVYVVHAAHSPGRSVEFPGTFLAYAGADPGKVDEVVDLMLENIARVQGSAADIQTDWFDRAKALIVTSVAMDNETVSEQASTAAVDELYGLGYDYHDRFAERIRAVSLADVQADARRRLSRAVVTISTPAPDRVTVKPGRREYERFPPVDLAPSGAQHDGGGRNP